MNYNLTKPCDNCPFRSDKLFPLRPERAEEIIYNGGQFACHKTARSNDDGDTQITQKSEHCAGLLILLEKNNKPHQMMRIAERFGAYDRTKLDMNAPVYDDPDEYIHMLEELV